MTPTDSPAPLIVCSAGNETTHAMIDAVAALTPDRPVIVLRAWRSAEYALASATTAIIGAATVDYAALDETIEGEARDDAAAGAEYARSLGLEASSEAVRSDGPVWRTILECADAHAAQAIVTGTRGRGDVESAILGSTSHALLQHSPRPVIVLPSHAASAT